MNESAGNDRSFPNIFFSSSLHSWKKSERKQNKREMQSFQMSMRIKVAWVWP